ncbi:hypothetical protein [Hyalangium versicolor]|uniref:hypothetical protein n=1 Tax=Hyalangium versicolor TaxID=2861190 RepID=UPI001CC9DF29|nr:hypothetical protein [Hyalangium versicolor]
MRLHLIAALLAVAACSRTTEGPTPALTGIINPRQRSVAPARVCNAQGGERGWRLELLGERFTPVPADVLTDTPTVGMPEVTVKGSTTLTLERGRVSYRDSTLLFLDIPTRDTTPAAELPAGSYAVSVKNPGGGTAEVADLLIVVEPPAVTRVTAPQGFTFNAPSPLVVEGTGFRTETFPAMKLTRTGFPDVELFTTAVESPTRLLTEVPSGTPEGTYDFEITNPEGCAFTLPMALSITYEPLGLLTVEPRFGWQQRDQPVTIYNAPTGDQRAFAAGSPEVFMAAPLKTAPSETVDIPLRRVAFVSPTIITAVVPTCSGNELLPITSPDCPNGVVPGGPYALKVADTSGAVGEVPASNGFTVLQDEPPVIDSIAPSAIDTRGLDVTRPLVVTGRNFGAGAKVQLLKKLASGNILVCDLPATGIPSATSLSARVPTSIAAAQCIESTPTGTQVAATTDLQLAAGLFVVRVQNTADPAYANYSGLTVTNPSANPGTGPAITTQLVTPRADFPLVVATNDLGQPFLYALGGTSDETNALDSVEMAPITLYGEVGGRCSSAGCTFHPLERSRLGAAAPEPRRGHMAIVRTVPNDTSYLFVLGGRVPDATGTLKPVNTVLRAQVLKAADAPILAPPERLTQEDATLPTGTLYYRVSAVLGAGDAKNPNGETLASDEHPVKANEALNAARLMWTCVPGATKYRIYRTVSANQPSGAERLLEELDAPATPSCSGAPLPQLSYMDTGAKTPDMSGAQPLPTGALGRWVLLNEHLTVERAHAAAQLLGDTVYVAGGANAAGTTLASVERASFLANSYTFNTATTPAAFSSTNLGALNVARQRFSLAVASAETAPGSFASTAPDNRKDAWLLAVGGDNGTSILSSNVLEVAKVQDASGDLSSTSFTTIDLKNGTHGGWARVLANSLFQAGSAGNTALRFRSGLICPSGNSPGPCTDSSNFTTGLNDVGAFRYAEGGPRYLAGSTQFRAYVYVTGGLPDDTGTGTPFTSTECLSY